MMILDFNNSSLIMKTRSILFFYSSVHIKRCSLKNTKLVQKNVWLSPINKLQIKPSFYTWYGQPKSLLGFKMTMSNIETENKTFKDTMLISFVLKRRKNKLK